MIDLFKRRKTVAPLGLGRLEAAVMEILWLRGETNVRGVVYNLTRPLAYTTVMTTLDRLYKKGLLIRRKCDRAFVYSPRMSRPDLEALQAGDLLAGFLSGPQPFRDVLVSCLVDACGQHDEAILDELERKIRDKRQELRERGKS